ncbi:hypothetical protein Ddc_03120 [Ditylenchus destructor]|nr:hypothetical protein Ddc_03120 [Ditylenchus destructor]
MGFGKERPDLALAGQEGQEKDHWINGHSTIAKTTPKQQCVRNWASKWPSQARNGGDPDDNQEEELSLNGNPVRLAVPHIHSIRPIPQSTKGAHGGGAGKSDMFPLSLWDGPRRRNEEMSGVVGRIVALVELSALVISLVRIDHLKGSNEREKGDIKDIIQ